MNFRKFVAISTGSRSMRFLSQPLRYTFGIFYSYVVYPFLKVPIEVSRDTFFGQRMVINIPSALDIYITGGKSHSSELALAKFIVNTLSAGDSFIDVGAHYGYFSLLAASIVGKQGSVVSIEPSPTSFKLLKRNTDKVETIKAINIAIADGQGAKTFYEFSNKYSEYNTFDKQQFADEEWYKNNIPDEISVQAKTLSQVLGSQKPKIIKIDVEGAEYLVIKGLVPSLTIHNPIIVMEFLNEQRGNEPHKQAHTLLSHQGYKSFRIDVEGNAYPCVNIEEHLKSQKLDSDNIVFIRQAVEL